MSLDGIVAELESDDTDHVRAVLLGLTDGDRKALGQKARGWLTRGNPTRVSSTHAALAVLATAGGHRQAMVAAENGYGLDRSYVDHAVAILKGRDPAWLGDLVDALLDDVGNANWRLARGLVRAGAVPAPEHPEYFRGTVRGVPDYGARHRRPLVEQLDADPGLVGEHLLRMLSTEGAGRLLAYHDGFEESTHEYRRDHTPSPAATWRVALLTLAKDGRLDRGRLLDAALAAPLRDWSAADIAWYVGLHDALEPGVDEVAERQDTYVRLLTVEHGPSVKTAQRELARLLPDGRLAPEPLLAASRATLGRTDKASVAAHLRLLEKLAKVDPSVVIIDTVRIAEDHPRADIREQAAKILGRLGAEAAPEPEAPRLVPVPAESRPEAPRVEPVDSADELADVLLGLFEEIEPLEMERAIDGLLRFADERPSTADLLAARAADATYYDDDPRIAARVLTLAWLTPRRRLRDGEWPVLLGHTIFPAEPAAAHTFVGAIGRRLTGVAHAVRAGRQTSLALPTGADFSLDAAELGRRLRAVGRSGPVLELELVVALLRVPPAERVGVEVPRSLRKSAAVVRAREGRPPTWRREVASYQRQRWEPARRVPVFLDAQGSEGDAAAGILARSAPGRTVDAEAEFGEYESPFEQTLALGAALLPHDHDVLAAHAHPYLHRDLRKDRACSVPVVDAIARAGTVNGPPASSALVLALAAKDARGRTAAQDAIIDLARYGLLDGEGLGRQMALLLTDDLVVGQRVSGGLADCARASDAAVLPVLDALQEMLHALPGRRDAGSFLELAADLAERSGRTVDLPSELQELADGRSSSVLAKSARRLRR